tara:strand:- start:121 stop:408 length:288 start_codon:yes stop_codon:yes gene_type:complete
MYRNNNVNSGIVVLEDDHTWCGEGFAVVFDEEKSKQWLLVDNGEDPEEVEDDWIAMMISYHFTCPEECFFYRSVLDLLQFYLNNKDRAGVSDPWG